VCGDFLISLVRIVSGRRRSRLLSHGRTPMWIRLQDHPAMVLMHMALINRNEARISIVHVPPYIVADLEGADGPTPSRYS